MNIKQIELKKAVEENNFKKVKKLIKNKNIDLKYNDDYFLRYSASYGYTKIVKLLLGTNLVDASVNGSEALINAVSYGYSEIVSMLLADGKAEPRTDDQQCLFMSIKEGYKNILLELIKDNRICFEFYSNSAIEYADQINNIEIVDLLFSIDGVYETLPFDNEDLFNKITNRQSITNKLSNF